MVRASQAVIGDPPEPAYEGSPDGGAGGSGTARRGIGAALSGTKTLIRNRQLLWSSLLAGLVLVAHLIAQWAFFILPQSMEWRSFADARLLPSLVLTFAVGLLAMFCLVFLLAGLVLNISSRKGSPVSFFHGLSMARKYLGLLAGGSVVVTLAGFLLLVHPFIVEGVLFVHNPRWLLFVDPYHGYGGLLTSFALTFVAELLAVFCLVFLLAGLVLSISSKKGSRVSFFRGLAMARKNTRTLAGWSVVVALAGTLIFIVGEYSHMLYSAIWVPLFNVLNQFPFYLVYDVDVGRIGIPHMLVGTLILSAINVLLFILTLFVVPLLVLEGKSLKEAVFGSFTLMKKCWGEVAACVLGLGMVVFAALLAYLLFQVTGIYHFESIGSNMYSSLLPGDGWIALGFLYILALSSLVLIVATVGGIASLDLYTSAKDRESAG